jgi:hypothetical protein
MSVDADVGKLHVWLRDARRLLRHATSPDCLVLRFEADGRCSELLEYWHGEHGTHEPFAGWGT